MISKSSKIQDGHPNSFIKNEFFESDNGHSSGKIRASIDVFWPKELNSDISII